MLSRINRLRWYSRWPVKAAIFGLAVLAVCFPYPQRLVKHVARWSNPNRLVEADAAALQPLVREFNELIADGPSPEETLIRAERFVYEKVPYAWDWETWGVADFIPTVSETIEKGREDCDGRAVIAASLLTAVGIPAEIVTDFAHVWVRTEFGEAMGPGATQAVVATEEGLKIDPAGTLQLPRALAYGVAVFPFPRTLILTVVLWMLVIDWRVSWPHKLIPVILLIAGLLVLRFGGRDYYALRAWIQLCGVGMMLFGILWALMTARRYGRRNEIASVMDQRQVSTDGAAV
jgi:hypothetical protein